MPAGGGDPKRLGDGLIVKIRPEWSRGFSSLQDARDVCVALMEELDTIYTAIADAADFPALQAAVAAGRTHIKLIDTQDGEL